MPIDLKSQELELLFRQFEKGNVVLFAGAGFSLGAKNARGIDPPLASQLSEILASECGWKYDGEDLEDVFDQARKHLGTEGLREVLCQLYEGCEPASWHLIVPKILWYRIYTTNIDDVVENSYRSGGVQKLHSVVCPHTYQDSDIWYQKIQCVHLHGCVADFDKGFTFTAEEFAMQTAFPNPWYQAVVEDMQSKSFLFVGTRLNEPPMYHYLSLRSQKPRGVREPRAKAFLVVPEVSPIRSRQYVDQGFVVVQSRAEEFFQTIYEVLRGKNLTRIDLLKNRYPHQISALNAGILETQSELLRQFELVSAVEAPSTRATMRTIFFEGAEATWDDIRNNVDAQRGFTTQFLIDLKKTTQELSVFLLVGHAGSGKSTILRRSALELARDGHSVYFLKSPSKIEKQPVVDLIRSAGERHIFMFLDDATFHLESVEEIIKELSGHANVTFVLADRPHAIYPRLRSMKGLKPVILDVPYLDRRDCECIIDKLEEFGLLGYLQGKSRAEQLREFLARSRKQLLVAMKEATLGKGFDVILANEFQSLSGDSARLAYTVVCLAYMHGAPVRRRHLLACIEGTDFHKARVLSEDLREVVIAWNDSQDFLSSRHRLIARQVARETAPFDLKRRAMLAYLSQTSADVTPQSISRRTPEYRAYRGIINFDNMLDLFGEDYAVIGEVYGELKNYYGHDFLFWLQFGRAEVYFDHFSLAENYLKQSLGIREEGNFQAHHYMGVLFLKRALFQDSAVAAASDALSGEEILRHQVLERGNVDAYPYAALVTHKLRYLKKWGSVKMAEQLEGLYKLATEGLEKYPYDDAMQEAYNGIYREYLMQAVRDDLKGGVETEPIPPSESAGAGSAGSAS